MIENLSVPNNLNLTTDLPKILKALWELKINDNDRCDLYKGEYTTDLIDNIFSTIEVYANLAAMNVVFNFCGEKIDEMLSNEVYDSFNTSDDEIRANRYYILIDYIRKYPPCDEMCNEQLEHIAKYYHDNVFDSMNDYWKEKNNTSS